MAVYRTDIEKALDELISYEEGMKFQSLAVVLAKQKWPDLIACERKWDEGLDAHAPGSLAEDGRGKGLACSITASLDKIKTDAKKVQAHFDDVRVLIFATPQKVTNHTGKTWAREILETFGYELVVVSREEVITSLLDSKNASICRTQLGIQVTVEPVVEELFQRARDATAELTANWLAHPRLAGRPLIELLAVKVDKQGNETGELLSLDTIRSWLFEGRRVVLEGPAGRGKTTTLIQLGSQNAPNDGLAFLIDLPAWARSGLDILSFVANMQPFRLRGIDAGNLAALSEVAHFSFLLNGWNEVPEIQSEDAVVALRQLERSFPAVGIIVATRTHHISPPLPGAFRVKLRPLSRIQRADYLRQSLGSLANQLESKLQGDPNLDDLSRTPFILAEVSAIYQSGGEIPTTKIAVLAAVMELQEKSDEHRDHLQLAPLMGHGAEYLADLAIQMTTRGATTISDESARATVSATSSRLRDAGQIATLPEPSSVLATLSARHVLERLDYPSVTFRFEHQQFQEFYAARLIRQQLGGLVGTGDYNRLREFARLYANEPAWEEPLKMVAQAIGEGTLAGPGDIHEVRAGKALLQAAMIVDPIFAGTLSRLCGSDVWKEVSVPLGERLRSWFQVSDENHQQCALAGMIATGSEEFSDILIPLLTSDDEQISRGAYRAGGEFHLSSLGSEWRNVVKGWPERARIVFVEELRLHQTMSWLPHVLEDFATNDASASVRAEAIGGLSWIGAVEELERVLKTLEDDDFARVVGELSVGRIPPSLRSRALNLNEQLYESSTEPISRLRYLLRASQLGAIGISEKLKGELMSVPTEQIKDNVTEYVIKPALNIVRAIEPHWVSDWVARRIAEGSLWRDDWSTFITTISGEMKEQLLEAVATQELRQVLTPGPIRVLTAIGDLDLAEAIFGKLCEVASADAEEPVEDLTRITARQLEELFRALPPNVRIGGLSKRFDKEIDSDELNVLIGLLSRTVAGEADLRAALRDDLRQALRKYLKRGVPLVLAQDDYRGERKAYLATALARVGEPDDMADLSRLMRADIERVRCGRAALALGERTALAKGSSLTYSDWHVRAMVSLDPESAGPFLLEVLNEPEYESAAASGLLSVATASPFEGPFGYKKRDYGMVWEARAGRVPRGWDHERRERYATALGQHISRLLEERASSSQPSHYDYRLIVLGRLLAALDGHDSIAMVLRLVGLPGKWHGWRRVEALETLLFTGVELPAEATLNALNPTIDHLCSEGQYDNQSAHLLTRCLALLAFVDVPAIGINRIREVLEQAKLPMYELREVIAALGASRCSEALTLLRELVQNTKGDGLSQIVEEWIEAVAALGLPESVETLLSFVEPGDTNLIAFGSESYHGDILASHIARISQADDAVRHRVLTLCRSELSAAKRALLAKVVNRLGTGEAVAAGLNLIDDGATPEIPFELVQAVEAICLEQRPYNQAAGTFTYVPRGSNEIRAKLFGMVLRDNRRKRSAFSLLGQIEVWRLEYGRPTSEPRHPALESGEPWPPMNSNLQVGQA
jgi:hypothetical protein